MIHGERVGESLPHARGRMALPALALARDGVVELERLDALLACEEQESRSSSKCRGRGGRDKKAKQATTAEAKQRRDSRRYESNLGLDYILQQ